MKPIWQKNQKLRLPPRLHSPSWMLSCRSKKRTQILRSPSLQTRCIMNLCPLRRSRTRIILASKRWNHSTWRHQKCTTAKWMTRFSLSVKTVFKARWRPSQQLRTRHSAEDCLSLSRPIVQPRQKLRNRRASIWVRTLLNNWPRCMRFRLQPWSTRPSNRWTSYGFSTSPCLCRSARKISWKESISLTVQISIASVASWWRPISLELISRLSSPRTRHLSVFKA